eukprot:84790-Rhodomonas_salina.1
MTRDTGNTEKGSRLGLGYTKQMATPGPGPRPTSRRRWLSPRLLGCEQPERACGCTAGVLPVRSTAGPAVLA